MIAVGKHAASVVGCSSARVMQLLCFWNPAMSQLCFAGFDKTGTIDIRACVVLDSIEETSGGLGRLRQLFDDSKLSSSKD
jgi:hypothetical protein